jgi:hypothetical protein
MGTFLDSWQTGTDLTGSGAGVRTIGCLPHRSPSSGLLTTLNAAEAAASDCCLKERVRFASTRNLGSAFTAQWPGNVPSIDAQAAAV